MIVGLAASMVLANGFRVSLVEAEDSGNDSSGDSDSGGGSDNGGGSDSGSDSGSDTGSDNSNSDNSNGDTESDNNNDVNTQDQPDQQQSDQQPETPEDTNQNPDTSSITSPEPPKQDLPKCNGSFKDCVTKNGDVCKAGSTEDKCECSDSMSDCPKSPALEKAAAKGEPDKNCLFHPELSKCKSDNGKCPKGFFQNGYESCVPEHKKCPKGFHSHEDDETGQCIPDKVKCDSGFIRNPSFPECQSKQSVCRDHPQLDECTRQKVPNQNLFGKQGPKLTPTIIKIRIAMHKSGGNANSKTVVNNNLATATAAPAAGGLNPDCISVIKMAWTNNMQRGQDQQVDQYIDQCLATVR